MDEIATQTFKKPLRFYRIFCQCYLFFLLTINNLTAWHPCLTQELEHEDTSNYIYNKAIRNATLLDSKNAHTIFSLINIV